MKRCVAGVRPPDAPEASISGSQVPTVWFPSMATLAAVLSEDSLRSECLTRQAKNMTMGQALPQVSIGRVRVLSIPVPSKAEQTAIGQRVNSVMDAIKCESMHLRKLQAQKLGLMHDLLTGKVSVSTFETEALDA